MTGVARYGALPAIGAVALAFMVLVGPLPTFYSAATTTGVERPVGVDAVRLSLGHPAHPSPIAQNLRPAAPVCSPLVPIPCGARPFARETGAFIGKASANHSELGTVLANLSASLPGGPEISAVDSQNGWLYLAPLGGRDVAILNGSSVIATLNVSTSIADLVADPSNGIVYILNNKSDNVTLYRGLSFIRSIHVGSDPDGASWDPASGLVYVANCQSNNVSVLNASAVVATDRVDLCPGPPAYDPSSGWIYVPNQGANDVTVLNGSSTVTTIANLPFAPGRLAFDPVSSMMYTVGYPGETGGGFALLSGKTLSASSNAGSSTGGIAVDPRSGWVYLSDPVGGDVFVLNGTTEEAKLTSLFDPGAVVFDPPSSQVYIAGPGNSHVPSVAYAVRGGILLGSIGVPNGPVGFAVDPSFPWLYLLEQASDGVSLLSTMLGVTPTELSPSGTPAGTTEQGDSVDVRANLTGLGSSIGDVSGVVVPSSGLNCPAFSGQDIYLVSVNLDLNCTASEAGNYTVWFNVTDTAGGSVWSEAPLRVYSLPHAELPALVPGPSTRLNGAYVGQLVNLAVSVLGGTGIIESYAWLGLPASDCTGTTAASPQCIFPIPLTLNVSVAVTDSDGGLSLSPVAYFIAFTPLTGGPISGNRTAADIGQPVTFTATLLGGEGALNYSWGGVPSTACPSRTNSTLFCDFTSPGVYPVALTVADTLGETVSLGPLAFDVSALPSVSVPTVTRTSVDVNQSFQFDAHVSGGSGPYSYRWEGLPVWCLGADTATPSCLPQVAGVVTAQVSVIDSNGAAAPLSPPTAVVVSSDPQIETSVLSPPTLLAGAPWSFSLEMQGGLGPYLVNWSGLPPGCASIVPSVSCFPSSPGIYPIFAEVTDANGYSVGFGGATVRVLPHPASAPTGLFAELPTGWEYLLAGAAGLAGFAVAGITLFRGRRGPSSPERAATRLPRVPASNAVDDLAPDPGDDLETTSTPEHLSQGQGANPGDNS